MKILHFIPNSLTLLNLLAGCIAIIFAFMGRFDMIPFIISISLLADFCDGLFARLLKVHSAIGADLDSLADMVSFGVLPGVLLFLMTDQKMGGIMLQTQQINWLALCCFSITLFSALRLAIFNVDEKQEKDFIGLATPASTLFVVGVLLLEKKMNINFPPVAYVAISFALSFLLVSKIRMFSFKVESFSWKTSSWQYIFLALSIIALAWLKWASISFIIIIYIVLNLAKNGLSRRRKHLSYEK